MRQASGLLVLFLAVHAYSAPQFITFKEGKLAVNFGGYHAGVGIGGASGNGGLYAQAGTPHGQSAVAGLGGAIGTKTGEYAGGLFAGAQAAENVHASAGLGGLAVGNGYATGNGFATAQAGGHVASSAMGGQSSLAESTGYKVQSFEIPATVVKETEVSAVSVENKPSYSGVKKVHKEVKFESDNEVKPLPLSPVAETHVDAKVDIQAEVQPSTVLVKEVYVEPRPHIIEKTKIRTHYKPHHHHVRKTAYIGGYVGGGAEIPSYTPIQKRVDIGAEGSEKVGVIDVGAHGAGGQTTITKEVTVGQNPSFFADIFNIPISTLQAVGSFLSNSAAKTKVSVQKSATIQADSDSTSPKHASSSSSLPSSLSDTQISVETPSFSQIIDGIFSIPINTLGAVNKFLENNVTGRKRIQVQESSAEPARRLGPHARRKANKVIYVQQETSEAAKPDEAH